MIVDLFSFRGRASRSEFWLIHIVCGSLQAVAVLYLMFKSPAFAKFINHGNVALSGLTARNFIDAVSINRSTMLTIFLAPLVITVATAVRRLHDRDRSGWWVVAMLLPVFVALFLSDVHGGARPVEVDVLAILSAAWYFCELGVLDGSPGANSYAPARAVPEKHLDDDHPPLESERALRNAEAAMDRAIAERRAMTPAPEGEAPKYVDRRQGRPDTREVKVERRMGGDRRKGTQPGQAGQAGQTTGQGFGRRAS